MAYLIKNLRSQPTLLNLLAELTRPFVDTGIKWHQRSVRYDGEGRGRRRRERGRKWRERDRFHRSSRAREAFEAAA